MDLKPFFSYYGSKWRIAKKYPPPRRKKIIEPFAGSASYATRYSHLQVDLYDIDPVICGVWDFLIKSSKEDIAKLPIEVEDTNKLKVCQEAKWLIGFWMNQGQSSPKSRRSTWATCPKRGHYFWGKTIVERLYNQVEHIKHWRVFNKSYRDIENEPATWFIDPPYQGSPGQKYKCNFIIYKALARWCKERLGRVIVCENYGADWLPFSYLGKSVSMSTNNKRVSKEAIWTTINLPPDDTQQLQTSAQVV